ncbi:NCK-interacting protein with SH3 domain-like isoform X4 [Eriocheir sinensis]|nr:NCK-interacting protein with SH3 domain-like isoform X4 [Eriocheir sinensis]XP_050716103.1 NCK-interacting protein with SH3 domain-like isoform X4 [Eriocheir sinensis]
MLRSLYAYKGTHARTLGFQAGERFLEVGTSRDPNWMHVISERGALGYVPKNYVANEETEAVAMLEFIDGCLEATHLNASERGGHYSRGEQEALQRLVELRQKWHARCPPATAPVKRPAPPPPQRSASQLSTDSLTSLGGGLPSPNLPSTPRLPSLPPSVSSASLASEDQQQQKQQQQPASVVETTTSFMARGDSLVQEESSGSSEGHDTSIGYESEMRSDVESGVHASIKSLVSQVPEGYLRSLVEEVRSTASVSFTASHQVVEVVLKSLGSVVPALHPLCQHILSGKESNKDAGENSWQHSVDGCRLVELLEELRACKDDEQQRSWALHEDEHTIAAHLTDLLELLNTGDLEACRRVLALDDFRPLLTLVQYYQMETRWPLRRILLQVFGAVCQMSAANISYLSASVFPVELAREMLESTCSEEQLQYISLVLGMVLCMGDTLPYPHFSVMDESFLALLLEGIEHYNEQPDTEQLAELYLTLVLAFNLQYTTLSSSSLSSETLPNGVGVEGEETGTDIVTTGERKLSHGADMKNVIISILAQQKETKYFTEKLLLLFNREEDPLAMFEHEPRPPHSVLKMMRDMYSTRATASIFYTNDERVVCDIIIRQLTDLPSDDKRRNEYLHLLWGVVEAGGWQEHQHRRSEVSTCCSNILAEEEPAAHKDQTLVRKLLDAFPEFFADSN